MVSYPKTQGIHQPFFLSNNLMLLSCNLYSSHLYLLYHSLKCNLTLVLNIYISSQIFITRQEINQLFLLIEGVLNCQFMFQYFLQFTQSHRFNLLMRFF